MAVNLYWHILAVSAGIGFLITFIINNFNDWLLKKRWSVIHPDTMISMDVYKTQNPVEAMKQGMYTLFLLGWLSTLLFMVLWGMPWFHSFASGNIWIGAGTYAFSVYVIMMLVFLPIVHKGFFGVLYHPRVPYWSFALLFLYAVLLALLVPVASIPL